MSKSNNSRIRWDLIEAARARLETGVYDDPVRESAYLKGSLDGLLSDLKSVPIGDGHGYRDLVANALAQAFPKIVDIPMMRREVAISGGRADIEMPLKLETLPARSIWSRWERRYEIRSVLVETKNEKVKAEHADVIQLQGYLDGYQGRFGLLVSRNGFSRNALKTLADSARRGEKLIIPFDNQDLCHLIQTAKQGVPKVLQFLRHKELFVLEAG